jgi:glycine C-acetyltransferase
LSIPRRYSDLNQGAQLLRVVLAQSLVVESIDAVVSILFDYEHRFAEHAAIRMSDRLLEQGIFVVGFGFPVVPEGHARLRVQMSAAHTDAQIRRSLDAFEQLHTTA